MRDIEIHKYELEAEKMSGILLGFGIGLLTAAFVLALSFTLFV